MKYLVNNINIFGKPGIGLVEDSSKVLEKVRGIYKEHVPIDILELYG
ncbi:MAG: hypothetical protein QXS24_06485 [Desulfurococcaceae archaeon]